MEEVCGIGRDEEARDVGGACGFAEHHDAIRIAAESCDVIAGPGECAHKVESAVVPGSIGCVVAGKAGMAEPAQWTEAVVQGDHHDVVGGCQLRSIVETRVSDGIAAAVNPDENGETGATFGGRIDVQEQAVLIAPELAVDRFWRAAERRADLGAHRAECSSVAHARPGFGRSRCAPAQIAHGGCCVGQTQPYVSAGFIDVAFDSAERGVDPRRWVGGADDRRVLTAAACKQGDQQESWNRVFHAGDP